MGFHRKNMFTFPPEFAESIRQLSYYKYEVGGGILLDKKKRNIIKFVIFPSDERARITFDNTRYDFEFHTHPLNSTRTNDILYARLPSPADVASTFTTGVEELVFVRNHTFTISIKDKDAFENTKRRIRDALRDKKFDDLYGRYRAYFTDLYNKVSNSTKNVDRDKRVKYISSRWRRALKKCGLSIEKVNLKHAGINIY